MTVATSATVRNFTSEMSPEGGVEAIMHRFLAAHSASGFPTGDHAYVLLVRIEPSVTTGEGVTFCPFLTFHFACRLDDAAEAPRCRARCTRGDRAACRRAA